MNLRITRDTVAVTIALGCECNNISFTNCFEKAKDRKPAELREVKSAHPQAMV